jgi:hypothetical protein
MESIATSTSSFFNNKAQEFYFDYNNDAKINSESLFENSFDYVSTFCREREL